MKFSKFAKRAALITALLTAVVFVLAACGGGDKSKDESSGKTYTLTFSSYNPEDVNIGKFEKEAFEYIEKESGGRIKIEPYWNGTLVEAMDTWSGTGEGLADISFYYITLAPGVQTAGEVFTQYHSYKAPDMVNTLAGYRKVLEEIPEVQKEANDANLQILDVIGPAGAALVMTKDKNIKTPKDMSGMVIQAQGHMNDVLPSVGASGVSLGPADWYTSLEKGVVNALTMNWAGIRNFGLEDLATTYVTFGDNGGLYCGGQCYVMNLDKYSELPEDLQKIVVDGFKLCNDGLAAYDQENAKEVEKAAKDAGKKIYHIDEADMQPWYDLAEKSAQLWVKDLDAKGYDGEKIWSKFKDIMASQG